MEFDFDKRKSKINKKSTRSTSLKLKPYGMTRIELKSRQKVMNEPVAFIENLIEESKKYYNPYLAFSIPYNLLMYPFAAIDVLSPDLARKVFGIIGGIPWPAPINGSVKPKPLRVDDIEMINLGDTKIQGWKLGSKIILPTPGHSPCSVSLFWPEKKALFVSDADWIGNPVFMSSSLRNCISSLEKMKELTEAGKVELFLPAEHYSVSCLYVGECVVGACLG